jgi:hypothetical protein
MRAAVLRALAVAAFAACPLFPPTSAIAAIVPGLTPTDIRVDGGAGNWHPLRDFRVSWGRPPGTLLQRETTAIDYLVRDAQGNAVISLRRLAWRGDVIEHLEVPPPAGAYTAEFWLEDSAGDEGPHATAQLLFDGSRPGAARARAAAPWFGAGEDPALVVEGAEDTPPLSGIGGYVVDAGVGDSCAMPDRCLEADLDLRAPGRVNVGVLPEGVNMVRVFAVSGAGLPSPSPTPVPVRVDLTPPAVSLGVVPTGWVRGPLRLTARAEDPLSGMTAAGPAGPITAIAVDGGAATIAQGDSATAPVSGSGVHDVAYYARDAAGNGASGAARHTIVRLDEDPPRVAFGRSQDPAEPERIEARASDELSGPSASRGTIAVRPVGSTAPFQALPTSVAETRLVAAWDSEAFPPGSYEFRATAYDAVGNSASSERRTDGARMVLANPLKRGTRLQLGFGGRRLVLQRCARSGSGRRCHRQVIEDFASRPTARSIGYGHGASVAGQLTDVSGRPLAATAVELIETFDGGAAVGQRTTTVQTGTDGRFVAHLPPGPSRRVEAVFAGSRVQSRASAGSLRLGVLGSVRLRASSATAKIGGGPVVFRGQVGALDARMPASGRPVELQFRVPGQPWSEFRTVQTDAAGRFRYAYAFADDDSRGVRFQFRAVVPASEGWPYETAASRPVFVTGR